MSLYIFILYFYNHRLICVLHFMTSPLVSTLGPRSLKGGLFTLFEFVSVWLHRLCGKWEGLDPVNRFNLISLMTLVTPTTRPKSSCNHYVIKHEPWIRYRNDIEWISTTTRTTLIMSIYIWQHLVCWFRSPMCMLSTISSIIPYIWQY